MSIFEDNMAEIMKSVRRQCREVLQETAEEVLEEAVAAAPEDEGDLKRSGRIEPVSDLEIAVGFEAEHAPLVEYGTGERGAESDHPEPEEGTLNYSPDWPGMPAQPYLTPAGLRADERLQKRIEEIEL